MFASFIPTIATSTIFHPPSLLPPFSVRLLSRDLACYNSVTNPIHYLSIHDILEVLYYVCLYVYVCISVCIMYIVSIPYTTLFHTILLTDCFMLPSISLLVHCIVVMFKHSPIIVIHFL